MIKLPKTYEIPEDLDHRYKGELAVAWVHAKKLGHVFDSDEAYKQWRRESAIVRYARDKGCYEKKLAVTFETAVAYGHINEVLCFAHTKKTWGSPVSFRKLHSEETEYLKVALEEPDRLSYILRDSNPIKQKQITRNEYKLIFGADMVNRAMQNNLKSGKTPFVNSLSCDEMSLLSTHGMSSTAFWRDVRNGNIEWAMRIAVPDKKRNCQKKHYLNLDESDGCMDPFLNGVLLYE